MRNLRGLCLLLVITVMLSGCVSGNLTIKPIPTVEQHSSPTSFISLTPTSIPLTSTLMSLPKPTVTLTPPATLEPEQANDAISTLLQESGDCLAPCFWGIIPGRTTFGDAENIFTHLGIELQHTNTQDNKDFYASIYDFDNGVRISPILTIQNDIVKNLRIGITPETQKVGVLRKWLAYSPETLIKQYGPPSKVTFEVGRGSYVNYGMVMNFDTIDLIVEYGGSNVGFKNKSFSICPVTDQSDGIRIWMGKNPDDPPAYGISLEDATSLTLEKFSNLMTGPPKKACLNLKEEMFP